MVIFHSFMLVYQKVNHHQITIESPSNYHPGHSGTLVMPLLTVDGPELLRFGRCTLLQSALHLREYMLMKTFLIYLLNFSMFLYFLVFHSGFQELKYTSKHGKTRIQHHRGEHHRRRLWFFMTNGADDTLWATFFSHEKWWFNGNWVMVYGD